jgi:hypothetical protein
MDEGVAEDLLFVKENVGEFFYGDYSDLCGWGGFVCVLLSSL